VGGSLQHRHSRPTLRELVSSPNPGLNKSYDPPVLGIRECDLCSGRGQLNSPPSYRCPDRTIAVSEGIRSRKTISFGLLSIFANRQSRASGGGCVLSAKDAERILNIVPCGSQNRRRRENNPLADLGPVFR